MREKFPMWAIIFVLGGGEEERLEEQCNRMLAVFLRLHGGANLIPEWAKAGIDSRSGGWPRRDWID
jgi:hypothetical protein